MSILFLRVADSGSTVSFSSARSPLLRLLAIFRNKSSEVLRHQTNRELVYRPLQFQKCSHNFIGANDEAPSVVAVRVRNKDCLPLGLIVATQPQLQPALLRFSAIASQLSHGGFCAFYDETGNVIETHQHKGDPITEQRENSACNSCDDCGTIEELFAVRGDFSLG